MRATVGKLIKPTFDAVLARFDQTTDVESHRAQVDRLIGETRAAGNTSDAFEFVANRISSSGEADADLFARWFEVDPGNPAGAETDPTPDTTAFVEDAWSESPATTRRAAWARLAQPTASSDEIEAVLEAFPPKRWFVFKRGVFLGSATLLAFFVRWAGTEGSAAKHADIRRTGTLSLQGVVDVLDRLIKHIEVRRNEALPFHPGAESLDEAEARIERLRFAMVLIEASCVFDDLRYLNTGLKLVDRALGEQRRFSSRDLELAYLYAFCFQEERLDEVLST